MMKFEDWISQRHPKIRENLPQSFSQPDMREAYEEGFIQGLEYFKVFITQGIKERE